jgi:hypothetical protein
MLMVTVASTPKLIKHQLKIRIFDVEANIESDSRVLIDLFEETYHYFRVNGTSMPVQQSVKCVLLTHPANPWNQPVMIVDEVVWPLQHPNLLTDPNLLTEYVYDNILLTIIAQVRTHFLIHAGAVADNGQGIILAADSFHGKTTLVLELVRRGFKFLSDETAALGRTDKRLHPFPRRLRVRPETWALTGFQKRSGMATRSDTFLLDIEQACSGSMGECVNIGHIIILRDPLEEERAHPVKSEGELRILVDHVDDAFLAAVRQIEGVIEVQVDHSYNYPLLKFQAVRRMSAFSQLEVLCQQERVLILNVFMGSAKRPAFDKPPRLEAIPASQAVIELLRRFQGGHKSAILGDEFGGNSTRLFMELASIVGQADCHQLFVGPLHEMADLVCGLVDK